MGYVSLIYQSIHFRVDAYSVLQFETLKWSLEPEDGKEISLLETEGRDPLHQEIADKLAVAA